MNDALVLPATKKNSPQHESGREDLNLRPLVRNKAVTKNQQHSHRWPQLYKPVLTIVSADALSSVDTAAYAASPPKSLTPHLESRNNGGYGRANNTRPCQSRPFPGTAA